MSAVHPIGRIGRRMRSPMQSHGCLQTDHPITQDSPILDGGLTAQRPVRDAINERESASARARRRRDPF